MNESEKQEKIVQEREDRAIDFEQRFGTELFIKTVLSTLSRILIEKGVATEEEISETFDEQIFNIEKEYRKYKEKEE